MESEQTIINNLKEDLKSKSIEELIYLNFNPSFYVEKSTQSLREQNEQLLGELNELNENYRANKVQYDNIMKMLNDYKNQYEMKNREFENLKKEKERIDSQITVGGLQNALKEYTDMNYTKPKQQLVNDFLGGKVNLYEFTDKFKNLNLNYHYYSIVRDKLNLCKDK